MIRRTFFEKIRIITQNIQLIILILLAVAGDGDATTGSQVDKTGLY